MFCFSYMYVFFVLFFFLHYWKAKNKILNQKRYSFNGQNELSILRSCDGVKVMRSLRKLSQYKYFVFFLLSLNLLQLKDEQRQLWFNFQRARYNPAFYKLTNEWATLDMTSLEKMRESS